MTGRKIGDLTISRVLELTQSFPALDFFPETNEDDWAPHLDWLKAEGAIDAATGDILLPMQSYLLQTTHHTILLDTCIGNDKNRPHRPAWHMKTDDTYMAGLAAHGVAPEDIDYVMCTHLHHDHVGWNTKLVDGRWVPTFPNAKYVISQREFDVWSREEHPSVTLAFADSVLPIVESGQAQMVKSDFALDDEVWLEPSPGHTPDHFSIKFASNGADAVMAGDIMHSPVQCLHPEWPALPDWDVEMARNTRREFLDRYAETPTLVCMCHFPLPSSGTIARDGDGFRFQYDDQDW